MTLKQFNQLSDAVEAAGYPRGVAIELFGLTEYIQAWRELDRSLRALLEGHGVSTTPAPTTRSRRATCRRRKRKAKRHGR
jgi:hypothetical protein